MRPVSGGLTAVERGCAGSGSGTRVGSSRSDQVHECGRRDHRGRIMKRSCALVTATLLAATAACGGDEGSEDGEADGGGGSSTLTVFAAASLTDGFEQIGEQFEAANDGVEVEFSFAGSSDLVAQIQSGAPADVFASANEENMEKLTADGLDGSDPEIFATNILQIAVPPDNPASVESFQDRSEERRVGR